MPENRSILLIDDDELYCQTFAQRLGTKGFSASWLSSDFENVLTVIKERKVELVLLDLVMPKTDGKIILANIRTEHERNHLPVIMVTGMDHSSDVRESFALGANDYISKPISVDVAAARISAHLGQCDLDRELKIKNDLELLNAIVTTYCHEINNPLAIAVSELSQLKKTQPTLFENELKNTDVSIQRIREIMQKIRSAGDQSLVQYESYAGQSKMLKIK